MGDESLYATALRTRILRILASCLTDPKEQEAFLKEANRATVKALQEQNRKRTGK